MFTCPNCNNQLTQSKSKVGIFWFCQGCNGRAVTFPVLRKAIDKNTANRLWLLAVDERGTEGRACPGCERSMCEIPFGPSELGLRLDVCRRCQIVWFDPKEYELLPPAALTTRETKEDQVLSEEAREALAMLKLDLGRGRSDAGGEAESWAAIFSLFGM